MESVRHCLYLLSEEFEESQGNSPNDPEELKRRVERFNPKIEQALVTFSPERARTATQTAKTAAAMNPLTSKDVDIIDAYSRNILIEQAKRCLAWAHDPARTVVPGAEDMTKDQAAAVMLYTKETCLYPRLNAALRKHDMRSLEPFLPFMKLLLSALYQLPLTHVRTYRGVKLDLFETYNLLVDKVWCWWSFSSTTRNRDVLDTPLFLGTEGKRTLFCINAVGVDIAPFSAMAHEEEVLLLPGLPLTNRLGENPERGLWTFDVETPDASLATLESPSVMIDYVHPEWNSLFHDASWRRLTHKENQGVSKRIPNHKIVPKDTKNTVRI